MPKLTLHASRKTKDTPAGEIPVDWAVVPLAKLVRALDSGVSVSADDRPAAGGEKAVLKLNAVWDARFFPEQNKTVSPAEVHRLETSPTSGCVIISRSNTPDLVGAVGFVKDTHPRLFLPDTLWQMVFMRKDASLGRWVAYTLASTKYRQILKQLASGTSANMKKLQKGTLLKLPIPLPPLPEQRKIADILSTWDGALEKLEALIAAKEKSMRAIAQQLLSNGRNATKRAIGTMTEKLGSLFWERVEQNHPELPLLAITANRGVIRRDAMEKRDTSPGDKSKYLRIAPGDIGYNTMRMWQGVSALSSMEGIISPAYTVCVPGPHIDGRFAAHFFKFPPTVHQFFRHSQGLVDDTLNLKFPNFARIVVTIPENLDDQRRIADILDACAEELRLLRDQRATLDLQKRGLMQRLLTGRVRVAP